MHRRLTGHRSVRPVTSAGDGSGRRPAASSRTRRGLGCGMAEPTTPTDAAALRLVAAAAINAFIGVAAGAFGAHGLRARLEPRMLEIFEVGVRYQMYHALAMLAAAWL